MSISTNASHALKTVSKMNSVQKEIKNSNKSKNNYYVYNPTECKSVKVDQDIPMHNNLKTYHWCHNHNDGNGRWVVNLHDECKASEK